MLNCYVTLPFLAALLLPEIIWNFDVGLNKRMGLNKRENNHLDLKQTSEYDEQES
jgi:hypothetical protein